MVKVFVSPWCPWCKEVTETILFNLLKGRNVEVIDPMSVDTRLGIFYNPNLMAEPSIYDVKNRCYFTSFLTKNHYLHLLRNLFLPTKKLEKKLKYL